MPTYYEILEVPQNATPRDIKVAFIKKSRLAHPDKCPDDPYAKQRFQELQSAENTLNDPEKRKKYDNEIMYITTSRDKLIKEKNLLEPIRQLIIKQTNNETLTPENREQVKAAIAQIDSRGNSASDYREIIFLNLIRDETLTNYTKKHPDNIFTDRNSLFEWIDSSIKPKQQKQEQHMPSGPAPTDPSQKLNELVAQLKNNNISIKVKADIFYQNRQNKEFFELVKNSDELKVIFAHLLDNEDIAHQLIFSRYVTMNGKLQTSFISPQDLTIIFSKHPNLFKQFNEKFPFASQMLIAKATENIITLLKSKENAAAKVECLLIYRKFSPLRKSLEEDADFKKQFVNLVKNNSEAAQALMSSRYVNHGGRLNSKFLGIEEFKEIVEAHIKSNLTAASTIINNIPYASIKAFKDLFNTVSQVEENYQNNDLTNASRILYENRNNPLFMATFFEKEDSKQILMHLLLEDKKAALSLLRSNYIGEKGLMLSQKETLNIFLNHLNKSPDFFMDFCDKNMRHGLRVAKDAATVAKTILKKVKSDELSTSVTAEDISLLIKSVNFLNKIKEPDDSSLLYITTEEIKDILDLKANMTDKETTQALVDYVNTLDPAAFTKNTQDGFFNGKQGEGEQEFKKQAGYTPR